MKQILYKKTALLFLSISLMAGCNRDDHGGPDPQQQQGTFVDMGYIPVALEGRSEFASNEFQTAAYHNHFVFVATSDGLWKNNLLTKEWSRSGFAGKKVSCIFHHPSIKDKLFAGVVPAENTDEKSLFISNDGGITWTAAASPIHDDLENAYEIYVSLAVRPNHPDHIYANMEGGTMIAVSTDGGLHWKRMNDEAHSYFGYRSNIVFLPDNENHIFQGSENPLDDAWLGRYDIDPKDPVKLTNFTKVVDRDVFGNRRPVELLTNTHTGNSIYVGQEGALSKVTGSETKFIFKAEEDNPAFPYTYVYGIWIDPKDTDHLVFGGAVNGTQTALNLFETFDEGKEIRPLTGAADLDQVQVVKIVATDNGPAIVVYDPTVEKVKLLLYKPE